MWPVQLGLSRLKVCQEGAKRLGDMGAVISSVRCCLFPDLYVLLRCKKLHSELERAAQMVRLVRFLGDLEEPAVCIAALQINRSW